MVSLYPPLQKTQGWGSHSRMTPAATHFGLGHPALRNKAFIAAVKHCATQMNTV
jgi:hypothetical protein